MWVTKNGEPEDIGIRIPGVGVWVPEERAAEAVRRGGPLWRVSAVWGMDLPAAARGAWHAAFREAVKAAAAPLRGLRGVGPRRRRLRRRAAVLLAAAREMGWEEEARRALLLRHLAEAPLPAGEFLEALRRFL
jgi:hypothetical protein